MPRRTSAAAPRQMSMRVAPKGVASTDGLLARHGISHPGQIFLNLGTPALSRALAEAPTTTDLVFGIAAVRRCPGVPDALLDPRAGWKDPRPYDAKAKELAGKFRENFVQFADREPPGVCEAGPSLWAGH